MTADRRPRIVTRRQAVGRAGAAGAALVLAQVSGPRGLLAAIGTTDLAQAATTSCVLTPAKSEGPYFVDERLRRSDIRSDPADGSVQPGVPLTLTILLVRADGACAAVPGAAVDIWHANAAGLYSDEAVNGTSGHRFLRGYQVSDANGKVAFTTIYPGWYSGRAVHIHFKVRIFDGTTKTYEFTSQLFFDPAVTTAVDATGSYASRGAPDTSNASDMVYGSDGSTLIVPLTADGSGGYAGTYVVGLASLPASTGGGGGGTGTNTVQAYLKGASCHRTATGRRVLRVNVKAKETVAVNARLARSGSTLVRRKVAKVKAGTQTLSIRVPSAAAAGSARLSVTFTDGAGATKTAHRSVRVPRRSG